MKKFTIEISESQLVAIDNLVHYLRDNEREDWQHAVSQNGTEDKRNHIYYDVIVARTFVRKASNAVRDAVIDKLIQNIKDES